MLSTWHLTPPRQALAISRVDHCWSGCRHQIGEVLLNHIFTDLKVETSRSPEVTLFTRLRDNWDLVPHKDSVPLSRYIPDEAEPPFLGKLRAELIASTTSEATTASSCSFVLCIWVQTVQHTL